LGNTEHVWAWTIAARAWDSLLADAAFASQMVSLCQVASGVHSEMSGMDSRGMLAFRWQQQVERFLRDSGLAVQDRGYYDDGSAIVRAVPLDPIVHAYVRGQMVFNSPESVFLVGYLASREGYKVEAESRLALELREQSSRIVEWRKEASEGGRGPLG